MSFLMVLGLSPSRSAASSIRNSFKTSSYGFICCSPNEEDEIPGGTTLQPGIRQFNAAKGLRDSSGGTIRSQSPRPSAVVIGGVEAGQLTLAHLILIKE